MTNIDTEFVIAECNMVIDYIWKCRKNHKKISTKFISNKGKSIMDYANQCYCIYEEGRIPICGVNYYRVDK